MAPTGILVEMDSRLTLLRARNDGSTVDSTALQLYIHHERYGEAIKS